VWVGVALVARTALGQSLASAEGEAQWVGGAPEVGQQTSGNSTSSPAVQRQDWGQEEGVQIAQDSQFKTSMIPSTSRPRISEQLAAGERHRKQYYSSKVVSQVREEKRIGEHFLQETVHFPPLTLSQGDMLLVVPLISLIIVSIVGNCLVCVAIFTDRRLRKLGNAFIVSLAIADLLVSCLVMTFALCNDLMNYWMFGDWFCDIWISCDVMCSTASILNLCAISLDRFIHIKDCLFYNQWMTKKVALSAVVAIWFISGLVSFVPITLGWHKPPDSIGFPLAGSSGAPSGGASASASVARLQQVASLSLRLQQSQQQQSPRVAPQEAAAAVLLGAPLGLGGGHWLGAGNSSAVNDNYAKEEGDWRPARARRGAQMAAEDRAPRGDSEKQRQRRSQMERGNHSDQRNIDTLQADFIGPVYLRGDNGGAERGPHLAQSRGARNEKMDLDWGQGGESGQGGGETGPPCRNGDKLNYSLGLAGKGSKKDGRGKGAPAGRPHEAGPIDSQLAAARQTETGEEEEADLVWRRRASQQPPTDNGHSRGAPAATMGARVARSTSGVRELATRDRLADHLSAPLGDHSSGRLGERAAQEAPQVAPPHQQQPGLAGNQQQQLGPTQQQQQQGQQLPQCTLTLTPTYAVVSSTISFYIPCLIMLGLYSKLFVCAQRHVRNIRAITRPIPAPTSGPLLATGGPLVRAASSRGHTHGAEAAEQSSAVCAPSAAKTVEAAELETDLNNNSRPNAGPPNSRGKRPSVTFAPCEPAHQQQQQQQQQTRVSAPPTRTWLKLGRPRRPPSGCGPPSAAGATGQQWAPAGLHSGGEREPFLPARPPAVQVRPHEPSEDSKGRPYAPTEREQQSAGSASSASSAAKSAGQSGHTSGLAAKLLGRGRPTLAGGSSASEGEGARTSGGRAEAKEAPARATPQTVAARLGAGLKLVRLSSAGSANGSLAAGQQQQLGALGGSLLGGQAHNAELMGSNQSELANQQAAAAAAKQQTTSQLATHKAAITLGIIMGTFLFCWVPFFCLNIIRAFCVDCIPSSMFRAFTWLGYANSALNPIIYGIHNTEFRNAFNRIFFKHLSLKNGRQYLSRRFSYDLRHQHHQHHHHHHQHHHLQPQQQHSFRRHLDDNHVADSSCALQQETLQHLAGQQAPSAVCRPPPTCTNQPSSTSGGQPSGPQAALLA